MAAREAPVPVETSRRMARIARRDTAAELMLRRVLFAAGCRYRVQYAVPGRPRRTIDIAFTRAKVAVFVDGCYWHGCPIHGTEPKTNTEWWRAKLAANKERDADTTAHLERVGWRVLRVWEHEPAASAAERVMALVSPERVPGTGSSTGR